MTLLIIRLARFGATSEFDLSKVQMPLWFLAPLKQFHFRLLTPPHHTIQGSPRTPPFEDFHVVKRARMKLPRGSYSGRHAKHTGGQGQMRGLGGGCAERTKAQGQTRGFHSPVQQPTGSLVAAINRLSQIGRGTDSGKAVLCHQILALLLCNMTLIVVN